MANSPRTAVAALKVYETLWKRSATSTRIDRRRGSRSFWPSSPHGLCRISPTICDWGTRRCTAGWRNKSSAFSRLTNTRDKA
jgi:hypothetical protein